MLSALWDNNFWKEFSDIPCAKNLPIHEIFWYTEVFSNEIFRYPVTKNFEREFVIPPLLHKIYKSVVELMFVENFRKLDFKQ